MIVARLRAVLVAVLCVVALPAAGSPASNSPTPDLRRIKTVAVISALGSSFQFERVLDRPWEWLGPADSHFLEISDWGLDRLITDEVTAALTRYFAVKPIAFVEADFSSLNGSLLKRAALDLNGDPSIDAYIFILRDRRPDTLGFSAHDLDGLGLYRSDRAGKLAVYASYRVVVVNAYTGDIMASLPALTAKGALPALAAGAALWPPTPNALTQPQRDQLLGDEKKLIEATLIPTLKELNLWK